LVAQPITVEPEKIMARRRARPRRRRTDNRIIAFKRGVVPKIACINNATQDLGVSFDKLIRVLQKFVDHHFAPVWGTPAKLVKATRPLVGAWTLAFFDTANDAFPFLDKLQMGQALGRHRLGENGLPLAIVCVEPVQDNNEEVSVVASHELAEMLVDPSVNLWSSGPKRTLHAYEMCDVCEAEVFEIEGVLMSDFLYPAWFEEFRKPRSTQFDHVDVIDRPFRVLPGGYSQIRRGRKSEKIFGSKRKRKKFAREDRRFHRSEFRDGKGLRRAVTKRRR
jgi:hypothetical protein